MPSNPKARQMTSRHSLSTLTGTGIAPALLMLLVIPACTIGKADQSGQVEARDSAGVTLVTLPAFETGAYGVLRPDSVPTVSVGALDEPEYEVFERVAGARFLPDLSFAALDWNAKLVRSFDAEGAYQGSVGRPGAGPGEFQGPFAINRWQGDTLAIWDPANTRLQFIGPRAAWLGERSLPDVGWESVLGPAGDSGVMVAGTVRREPPPAGQSFTLKHAVRITSATREDTIFTYDGATVEMRAFPGGFGVPVTPPLAANPVVRGLGAGFLFASARDPIVEIRDHSGALDRVIRIPDLRRPVEADEFGSWMTRAYAWADEAARERGRQLYEGMTVPDRHSALADVRVALDGALWIEDPIDPREDTVQWTVLGPDLRSVARITLPWDWRLEDAAADRILVQREVDGVPRLEVYRLSHATRATVQ